MGVLLLAMMSGAVAAAGALIAGQPLSVVLAVYSGSGVLSALILAGILFLVPSSGAEPFPEDQASDLAA